MKHSIKILGLGLLFATLSAFAKDTAKKGEVVEVKMFTEQKDGGPVHWMPEEIVVHPGDTVHFHVEHRAKGGFDFHGFQIPQLQTTDKKKVEFTVTRKEPADFKTEIPKDLKPGVYDIKCQYHPAHVGAKIKVEPRT